MNPWMDRVGLVDCYVGSSGVSVLLEAPFSHLLDYTTINRQSAPHFSQVAELCIADVFMVSSITPWMDRGAAGGLSYVPVSFLSRQSRPHSVRSVAR